MLKLSDYASIVCLKKQYRTRTTLTLFAASSFLWVKIRCCFLRWSTLSSKFYLDLTGNKRTQIPKRHMHPSRSSTQVQTSSSPDTTAPLVPHAYTEIPHPCLKALTTLHWRCPPFASYLHLHPHPVLAPNAYDLHVGPFLAGHPATRPAAQGGWWARKSAAGLLR